jgi:hypothetical protein
MSNTEELKKYLLEKENPFLLDENNNGKTIMISGAWGAGKTHFWQEEIEPKLSKKLKNNNKACVYVSLYGKENIETLKNEILFKAYESIKEENKLKKRAISAFGMGSNLVSFSLFGFKVDAKDSASKVEEHYQEKKIEEAESFIEDGGVVCLDDFERKSKKIDLNDLFGFISQLAVDMNCKIVIILNSDVFTGKEAEVFRNVKEKTVNKFFYFEPSIEELFESIAKDKKYNKLKEYKADILKAIKETEELNARIYIQVLDNCLEWLEVKENLDEKIVRVLVLGTFNFVLNHMVLDYQKRVSEGNNFNLTYQSFVLLDDITGSVSYNSEACFSIYDNGINYRSVDLSTKLFIEKLKKRQVTAKEVPEQRKLLRLAWIKENEQKLKALWKYGYRLYYVADVEEEIYNEIAKFIKSGILI